MKETKNIEKINFDVCAIDPETPYIWNTDKVRKLCRRTADENHKYIIFYYGFAIQHKPDYFICTKFDLNSMLKRRAEFIETTILSSMSFGLLNCSYRIFLAYNDRCIEIEPNMRGIKREIRIAHNISRLTCAGCFHHLLEIPEEK